VLAGEYRLNLAVADIAEQVETVSGKGIDFRSVPMLDGRARAKMARGRMERHLVLFNPNERPHLSHILAHECARIVRMFKTPPADRKVPASTSATLRVARDQVAEQVQSLRRDLWKQVVEMWIHGLITQVTSQPIDVRIERWMHEQYTSLHREQRRSLRTESRTITASLSAEVKRVTPAAIFRRSHALNYAYLHHIGDIVGRSFEDKFRGNQEVITMGEVVSQILDDEQITDRELVNQVAEAVLERDWFVWIDFEDMPQSYYLS